jgi:hypothetical protein
VRHCQKKKKETENLSKNIDGKNKSRVEMLKLKNTTTKIKSSVFGFNKRMGLQRKSVNMKTFQ